MPAWSRITPGDAGDADSTERAARNRKEAPPAPSVGSARAAEADRQVAEARAGDPGHLAPPLPRPQAGGLGLKEPSSTRMPKGPAQAVKAGFLQPKSDVGKDENLENGGFWRGCGVRLRDLKAAPELNGTQGTCENWDAAKGRWQVRLNSSGEVKLFRPVNLEELPPPTAAFKVGDSCEVARTVLMREAEDLESAPLKRLPGGSTVDVVRIGTGSTGKRLCVRDYEKQVGWVSVVAENGEELLLLTEKDQAFRDAFAGHVQARTAKEEQEIRDAYNPEQQKQRRQLQEENLVEWKKRTQELRKAEEEKWKAEAEERKASLERQRPDYGKPTAQFNLGDLCEVINGIVVRGAEDLESTQLRKLPNKSQVEVVGIGTGSTGKRVCIRDEHKREGWVSVVSQTGESLLRRVGRVADPVLLGGGLARASGKVNWAEQRAMQRGVEAAISLDECAIAFDIFQEKMQKMGITAFDPRFFTITDAHGKITKEGDGVLDTTVDMFPLLFQYKVPPKECRPGEGIPVNELAAYFAQVAGNESVETDGGATGEEAEATTGSTEEAETALEEVPASETSEALVLKQSKHLAQAMQPELPPLAPVVRTPGGGTLVKAEPARCKLPWEVDAAPLGPEELARLDELEKRLKEAFEEENVRAVEEAVKEAQALGSLPEFMRQHLISTWRGPKGHQPFEYKGKVYAMRTSDSVLFDPPSEMPLAIWNAATQRIEAVQWKVPLKGEGGLVITGEEDEIACTQVSYFGKTWKLMPRGELIDDETEMVVGAFNMDTMRVEPIEPVPLQVAEFMEKRGFRLQVGGDSESTASSSSAPSSGIGFRQRNPTFQIGKKEIQQLDDHLSEQDQQKNVQKTPFIQLLKPRKGGLPSLEDRKDTLKKVENGDWLSLKHGAKEHHKDRELVLKALQEDGNRTRQSWQMLLHAPDELRQDRELVEEAIRQDPQALALAAPELRSDRELLMEAVQYHPLALRYADATLCSDRELVFEAVSQSWWAMKYAAKELHGDRELLAQAVSQSWQALQYATEDLCADRELVMVAIRQSWRALQYVATDLRADAELMLEAMRQSFEALQFASFMLLADPAFMTKAVQVHGLALCYAMGGLRGDASVVHTAVSQNWRALQFASEELRADRTLVLGAIRQNSEALSFATPELKWDHELFLEACSKDRTLLRLAPEDLRADFEFMFKAVRRDGLALRYATAELRRNHKLVLEAVCETWEALKYADEELRGDRDFMCSAVRAEGWAFSLAAEDLRADVDLVFEAIAQDWGLLCYASRSLCMDRSFMLQMVRLHGLALAHAAEDLRADKQLVLTAVRQDGQALEHASPDLQADHEVVLEALKQDWTALQLAAEPLHADRAFVLRAVSVQGQALRDASEDLRADPDVVLMAVRQDWKCLKYSDQRLRDDLDFMLEAVRIDPLALSFAAEEIRGNNALFRASLEGGKRALPPSACTGPAASPQQLHNGAGEERLRRGAGQLDEDSRTLPEDAHIRGAPVESVGPKRRARINTRVAWT